MILSDGDIRREIAGGRIEIDPFDEACVQPSSVDLHVDNRFRIFANTRLAAGEPLTRDWLKCELKALDFASSPVTFTDAQRTRLQAAFPQGVCDYSRPGVGQQPPDGPWLVY